MGLCRLPTENKEFFPTCRQTENIIGAGRGGLIKRTPRWWGSSGVSWAIYRVGKKLCIQDRGNGITFEISQGSDRKRCRIVGYPLGLLGKIAAPPEHEQTYRHCNPVFVSRKEYPNTCREPIIGIVRGNIYQSPLLRGFGIDTVACSND